MTAQRRRSVKRKAPRAPPAAKLEPGLVLGKPGEAWAVSPASPVERAAVAMILAIRRYGYKLQGEGRFAETVNQTVATLDLLVPHLPAGKGGRAGCTHAKHIRALRPRRR